MLSNHDIEKCVIWACEQEVSAPKPGNVNCFSDGHNMAVQDFMASAKAIAPIMSQTNVPVGTLILQAIQATRAVVDCNTNLGIVLLFAPLCFAIHRCQSFEQLEFKLADTLLNLTLEDAKACYEAIRLADAGGMGNSDEQDIYSEPSVTLWQAMKIAEPCDSIAKQYVNNYIDVFNIGLPNLTSAIKSGESVEWSIAFAYLKLLSSIPDTLICRKQSLELAQYVTREAGNIVSKVTENKRLEDLKADLLTWDKELKKEAINPGTTADLIAATLLVYAFRQKLS